MNGKRKPKADAARIYSLPADYIRRSRYTAFLESERIGRKLLCWYTGHETGRLYGVYQSPSYEHPVADAYIIAGDGSLEYDEHVPYEEWDELLESLRKATELHCTGYLPYFMGLTDSQPGCGKVIPFENVA